MANSLKLYVDPNNANPSRLSRLPNAMRFDSRQELYALNVGSKSWQDFEAQIQAEAIGNQQSGDLLSFCLMQRTESSNILRVHICTFSD